jgi:8-hydroxy-5-deazaflavin:NADPH oxidoreductase
MKIGVLGTGDVGRRLGAGLATRGHEVMMGSRDVDNEKLTAWVRTSGPNARGGSFAEAARFGEVIILATLWSGTENAIRLATPEAFANKVVLDATNPLVFTPGAPPSLALGHTDSGGEQVQRWIPNARVVKAFNTVGNAHMVDPDFPDGPPDFFICGNDGAAKATVSLIGRELGWPATTDIGGIEGSRELEPLCILWVKYGAKHGSWNHAFKIIRK